MNEYDFKKNDNSIFVIKRWWFCFISFLLLASSCSFKTFVAKNKTVEYNRYRYVKGLVEKPGLKETITFHDSTFNLSSKTLNLGNIQLIEREGFYKQRNRFLILTCYDDGKRYYYFSNSRKFFILNKNTLVIREYKGYSYFKRSKSNGSVPDGAKEKKSEK